MMAIQCREWMHGRSVSAQSARPTGETGSFTRDHVCRSHVCQNVDGSANSPHSDECGYESECGYGKLLTALGDVSLSMRSHQVEPNVLNDSFHLISNSSWVTSFVRTWLEVPTLHILTNVATENHSRRWGEPRYERRRADGQECPSYNRVSLRRRGFTLMEVMLACVLGSMLSVVVIQLMRTTLLEARRIATSRQPSSETWLLRELIANDVGNARAYRVSKDNMVLGGFLTSDLESGAKTQQLSLVTYQIVRRGGRMSLERTELPFHSQQSKPRKDIVWHGVGSMIAYPRAEFMGSIESTLPELQQQGLQSLSGGMIVRIFDTQSKLLVEIQ